MALTVSRQATLDGEPLRPRTPMGYKDLVRSDFEATTKVVGRIRLI
jgi:hypothetical protein